MIYFAAQDVVRDPCGPAKIYVVDCTAPAKKIAFRIENNKQLNGVFDGILSQWRAAQLKWRNPFSFRAFLLAAVSASEYENGSDLLKAAVIHATLNWERLNKSRLEKMLIPDGKFGEQQGRYAATNRPISLHDILLAETILAGGITDPTQGAIQFDAPATQRILHRRKPKTYKHPAQIAKERQTAGLEPVYLFEENPELARFWRPTVVTL